MWNTQSTEWYFRMATAHFKYINNKYISPLARISNDKPSKPIVENAMTIEQCCTLVIRPQHIQQSHFNFYLIVHIGNIKCNSNGCVQFFPPFSFLWIFVSSRKTANSAHDFIQGESDKSHGIFSLVSLLMNSHLDAGN